MAQRTEQPASTGSERAMEDRVADAMLGIRSGPDTAAAGAGDGGDDYQPGDNRGVEEQHGQPTGEPDTSGEDSGDSQGQGQDTTEEEGDGEGQPTQSALVPLEVNGVQHMVAPEVRDGFMAQVDYTRKTQETAALRRLTDLERVQFQHRQQFEQAVAPELSELQQLDFQLHAYRNLDWTAMDAETATKTRIFVDQLKDQREDVAQKIEGKRQVFAQDMQNLLGQAIQKGDEYLRGHIKGWGPQAAQELATYGQSEGYSDVEMQMLTDARMKKTLWKAMQWDKLRSQQAAGQKRVRPQPPGAPVRAGATPQRTQQQQDNDRYQKALKQAGNDSHAKARVIQERVADIFGRGVL